MKTCAGCGQEKPLTEFYRHNGKYKPYRSECKECSKQARKTRYYANRERVLERNHISRAKALYGLTEEAYRKLYEKSNGHCYICGAKSPKSRPHVDHCHRTGRVRGLLCSWCNRGLGHFKDSVELLTKAAQYLEVV